MGVLIQKRKNVTGLDDEGRNALPDELVRATARDARDWTGHRTNPSSEAARFEDRHARPRADTGLWNDGRARQCR